MMPFGAVDPINRESVIRTSFWICSVLKDRTLVSHDIDEALQLGDRIAVRSVRANCTVRQS